VSKRISSWRSATGSIGACVATFITLTGSGGSVRRMRALPEGLVADAVAAALRDGWGFDVGLAEYAAVGAGSYHWVVADTGGRRRFVTADDLAQKAWLGDTPDAAFDGLRCAFDTAVALRDGGLEFVVAPLPASRGESLRRIDARYTIALFPLVEGEAGEFGYFENDGEALREVVALLAALHEAEPGASVRTAGLELPGRGHLEAALAELDVPWTGGPLAEPARAAVRRSASELAELLALADELAAAARRDGGDWVVTHGEPHAGNVMRTGGGRRLVDWDTVALAPRERDLWLLVAGGGRAVVDDYERLTGVRPSDAGLDYFRLMWELKDLAEYLNVLRAPHREDADTTRQLGALLKIGALHAEWIG
jgi:spectinomycin phosphotransferase